MMTFFKAILVGVGTALAAAVLLVIATVVLPSWLAASFSGSGGIGAVSVGSGSAALVLLAAFALGFFWTIRKRRRGRAAGARQPLR
jgi:MYXO-CTERM domain-containing protein